MIKNKYSSIIGIFFTVQIFCFANTNDINPLDVHVYKLKNGLTVYLNEDHNTTSVFGAVAVRGGGKRDPKDATGIAHYLEHLLFKGTDKLGTTNYELEKMYLDSIEIKYDELSNTDDESKRLNIQKSINDLSIKATEYAIPNEFNRIVEGMGGSWINAFTSDDAIVYLNKFPGNQIEKWLEVYSHRFINPVFRLFQSELETVYEEKNRSMDSPFGQAFEFYWENFYKNHPYGQQTVLGSIEHLKNPSLSKMKEYFNTYYVANNMALILTGDIYTDEIIPLIEEKFGKWEMGALQPQISANESEFNGRELISANMTPIKVGSIGFRTVPANHSDELLIDLSIAILTNQSRTGLIDKLVVEGRLQDAGIFNMSQVDLGGANFFFFPLNENQSLEDAENLVGDKIEKLKGGDFDTSLFNAVKLTMMRQHEENIESMERRLFNLINVYINRSTWEDLMNVPNRLEKISKDDVVNIANKYFGDNCLVFYSNEGSVEKDKLNKPEFEPVVPQNSEAVSSFAKEVEDIPEGELNLRFIEFDKDVVYSKIRDKAHLYDTNNPINNIFNLRLRFGIGTLEDPKLQQTAELLNLLGTENYTFNEFKSALQKIGTEISFYSEDDYFNITIKGFDKNLSESLNYLNEFIKNVKNDDSKINILVDSAISERKIENETPSTIGRAVRNFSTYGEQSYYLRRLSVKDIENSSSDDYIKSFYNAIQYEVDILYTGRNHSDDVVDMLNNTLEHCNLSLDSKSPIDLEVKELDEDTIYLVNEEDALQSQIYFSIVGDIINDENRSQSKAYNKYFSGGMSSIVFQEIREFRSLAYAVGANYSPPWRNGNKGHFRGYVGCQADKSLEAISVFKDITMNMPEKPERMDQVRSGLIKSINSERPNFRRFPVKVSNWIKMGYTDDPRKMQVDYLEHMLFNEIVEFQESHISGRPMVISILTDKTRINMEELEKYGNIIFLNKSDVLN